MIPLVDYVEQSRDNEINEVPVHVDRLVVVLRTLHDNGLLVHMQYAAINGVDESYEIVKGVSEAAFGHMDDDELEKILEYYAKVHLRVESLNNQNITSGIRVGNIMDAAITRAFLATHGESDAERPVTPEQVFNFVYVLHDMLAKWEKKVGSVEQYRNDFCKDLQKLVDQDLIDQDMLDQLVYMASTVNITIVRPLDYLCSDISAVNNTVDSNAHYRTDTHSMNVNIVTGAEEKLKPAEAKALMRHIVYHELVHAITLPWAETNGASGYMREFHFPKFVTEAFAERIAATMLDDATSAKLGQLVAKKYVSMRSQYDDYPTAFIAEDRQNRSFAYPEYQYLLDMMMAKLDWDAAGISREEAEKLLCRALLDGPSKLNEVDKACPHWHAFHEALTKASFSGILVHLREIFDYEDGEQTLLNYFDSPRFDPHDRDSLPRTLTTKQYDWDNHRETDTRDHAPDVTLLMGYARLWHSHYHGWRNFELLVERTDDMELPNTERQYDTIHSPDRFPELKERNRRMMDARNLARSAMLGERYKANAQKAAASL